ncbi:unnamed protein product [Danaus chrysippus]|uniref:(African queen) hypothetical protein n=1 Tax=Danaus chrysippus TaxID=151541 RepID=A0A8J2R670_9NEOP|nr:unnamed protein product [Danaus chrysippus]
MRPRRCNGSREPAITPSLEAPAAPDLPRSRSQLHSRPGVPGVRCGCGVRVQGLWAAPATITQVTKIDGKWADTACRDVINYRVPTVTGRSRHQRRIPNILSRVIINTTHLLATK